jgi:HEAT repeat protein
MLDGDDSDAGLVIALGGPPGQHLIDRGIPEDLRYWLRVWAGRGLFWVWGDRALPYVLDAAADEHWRVREWVGKIAGKHRLVAAIPVLRRLADDAVPRVRSAAVRALDTFAEP